MKTTDTMGTPTRTLACEIDNIMVNGFTMDLPLVTKEKEKEEEKGGSKSFSSSPTVPSDMQYEILCRVALDDLLRQCKWVCKYWNALTYNSTFKRFHSENTQSISGYFIQSMKKNRYHTSFISINPPSPSSISLDFMPTTDIKIEASSYQAQGLVCCVSKPHSTIPGYYVCKPVTRQWRQIPNPKTRYITEKMAIVVKKSQPLHYKIIRLSNSKTGCSLHCEIFDSKKWAWRMYFDNVKLPYYIILSLEPEVLVHGSFHWLTFGKHKQIFACDIDKENWSLISLPQSSTSSSSEEEIEAMNYDFQIHRTLVNCEGHLGLLYSSRSWMELWVMEDYMKKTWRKKYRVSLEPLNQMYVGGYSLLALDTMDMILVKKFDQLIWYNFVRGIPTKVMKLQNLDHDTHHPLNSDNVSCDLK
ncbi:hypothetical protein NE237_027632 [Protea cynaroides]|uniref:F-box associated beta-propeller type 3 domain-containing protein n=1 Tax=Protea cynaroides TaxID=273540 RepID=A0A9Q0GQV5_9MAGN|nr:hypothetical protein NE237_027632 [Protea cynaroides]